MIYEILYIIPSKFSDSEIEGVEGHINEILVRNEAKVLKTSNLGKIKIAYPIKREKHGTYVLTYIEVAGVNLAKIDQDLRLSEEVLRHVLVKRPEGVSEKNYTIGTYVEPLTSEGKRTRGKRETVKEEAVKPAKKLSTAALDKKLDEILDSDIASDM